MASSRFGYWASLITALMTAVSFAIAIATPPLAGPLCESGCIEYPYLHAVNRFPRDYYWMFPAIVSTLCYLAMTIALRSRARSGAGEIAELSVAIAVTATVVLVGDYFVQLAVMQPSLLRNERDGVAMLSQYNPHGVFIALEELGYLLISVSLAIMAAAMSSSTSLERAVKRLFACGFMVNVVALSWIAWRYGHEREYRFEIAAIGVDWTMLIVGGGMLAAVFRNRTAAVGQS